MKRSELGRSSKPMKRTEMKRSRKPIAQRSAKMGRKAIQYSRVRKDVEGRSNGRCEMGTPVCTLRGTECHHLLPRSQGGKDDLGNCVWTCHECHRHAHDNPAAAYEHGWLLHAEGTTT